MPIAAAPPLDGIDLLSVLRGGALDLFDLVADPAERDDVASMHPEVVTRLQNALHIWREDVGRMSRQQPGK